MCAPHIVLYAAFKEELWDDVIYEALPKKFHSDFVCDVDNNIDIVQP